ncbi:hypothetical protein ILYODFUR_006113 [Ilyodon furcidens]|uniref:Uncharacterized protein n=1 Tax=Ilyodon furcidens TaxID=33524 RepID=A0ABV0U638_9TELE
MPKTTKPSAPTMSPVWKPQSLDATGNYGSNKLSEPGNAGRSLPRERGVETMATTPVVIGEGINLEDMELK